MRKRLQSAATVVGLGWSAPCWRAHVSFNQCAHSGPESDASYGRIANLGRTKQLDSETDSVTSPREAAPNSVSPRLSVIVAVYNEAESIAQVCDELLVALNPLQPHEIVVVDDGSTDATSGLVTELRRKFPCLRLLRHDRRCGKSAALFTGINGARATWIATMDGDGQNDPADIVPMLRAALSAENAAPLVAGIRMRRYDSVSRRIATRFANGFRQAVLSDHCPDTGCGLKVFRRDDFLRLPMFEGMHRFLPALFQAYGHPLICQAVAHRPRLRGQSKYSNFGRAIVGVRDTLGVMWLRNRTRLPAKVTEA